MQVGAALFTAKTALSTYRRAVVTAACDGRLVLPRAPAARCPAAASWPSLQPSRHNQASQGASAVCPQGEAMEELQRLQGACQAPPPSLVELAATCSR